MSEPNNLVQTMIAKRISALMESGLSFDQAYDQFQKTASEGYKKYDLEATKPKIAEKVAKSRSLQCDSTKCIGKGKKEEKEETPKVKKGKAKKEKESKTENVETPPMPNPNPAPAVVSPPKSDKGYALPIAMKGDARVDFIEHPDGGVVLKKSEKAKKLAILCPDGTHGEHVDDDTIGCKFD